MQDFVSIGSQVTRAQRITAVGPGAYSRAPGGVQGQCSGGGSRVQHPQKLLGLSIFEPWKCAILGHK